MKPEPQTILLIDPPSPFAPFAELRAWLVQCDAEIMMATNTEVREAFEREKADVLRSLSDYRPDAG